ncbi:hypothetical protein [Methanolobus profundi]|uniref:Uncharacterized protein n=1 Tax=Methanolobus profundi TaxID=487685 RepID=A0A1I4PH61_9EURY|nr:hypothetical protein [Methanolobus profundi]SFM27152.1 hypothetical protein SAMN04488696_0656 [Methanolobus profundi]
MYLKQFVVGISLLVLLVATVGFTSCSEIIDVERHLPSDLSEGEIAEITLEITGESPFMVGIVETIPQGFTFPESDQEVSDSGAFKIDRDAGKISFSVSDSSEVTYYVIPSEDTENTFEGYWVDLLYQTQELNEGKERWITVTDPNSASNVQNSGEDNSGDTTTDVESSVPGFSLLVSSVSLFACVLFLRKNNSGEDEE